MGSGVLKTLSPDEVSHYQLLYIFSCSGYSSEPHVGLLLWSLSIGLCRHYLFFITDASVVDYRVASLAGTWGPISLIAGFIPHMLGAVAT